MTSVISGLGFDALLNGDMEVFAGAQGLHSLPDDESTFDHSVFSATLDIVDAKKVGNRSRARALSLALALEIQLDQRGKRITAQQREDVRKIFIQAFPQAESTDGVEDGRFLETPTAVTRFQERLRQSATSVESLIALLAQDLALLPFVMTLNRFDFDWRREANRGSLYLGTATTQDNHLNYVVNVALQYGSVPDSISISLTGIGMSDGALLEGVTERDSESKMRVRVTSGSLGEQQVNLDALPINTQTMHFLELLASWLNLGQSNLDQRGQR